MRIMPIPSTYAISRTYVPNGLNQYARAGQNAVPDLACPTNEDGCRTYRYDPNGNLIGDGVRTYVYDGENRLVLADDAAGTDPVRLVYDPLGRLSANPPRSPSPPSCESSSLPLTPCSRPTASGRQHSLDHHGYSSSSSLPSGG